MDVTKIEEARKLFTRLEDVERMHKFAMEEFGGVLSKSFSFQYIKPKEFGDSIVIAITEHFVALKDEIKAEIEKL